MTGAGVILWPGNAEVCPGVQAASRLLTSKGLAGHRVGAGKVRAGISYSALKLEMKLENATTWCG